MTTNQLKNVKESTQLPWLMGIEKHAKSSREKILKIRSEAQSISARSLKNIEGYINDHDWKVRLEMAKILRRYLEKDNLRKAAVQIIDQLRDDIHPIVRLCMIEVKKRTPRLKD